MAGRIALLRALQRATGVPNRRAFVSSYSSSSVFSGSGSALDGARSGVFGGSGRGPYFSSPTSWSRSWRRMIGTGSTLPGSDPAVQKAMKHLLAASWYNINHEIERTVEDALEKGKNDREGHEALLNSWRAALAVEDFYGILDRLKMAIDDLMGLSGENVGPLPDKHRQALEVAHSRYMKYLASFGDNEIYLKKKVENEISSMMLPLKQRCAGLGAEWLDVSLIGTSGFGGSYIEIRA